MSTEKNLENYWDLQGTEGKAWQEARYRNNGMVWGTEPGPTVPPALDFFQRHDAKSLLVVGCGYGRECMHFADHGLHVNGIDFSEEGIKIANTWLQNEPREHVHFAQGDALQLQFADNSFDAVFSHKVFHQFKRSDRERMMAEIYRVLKPGGVFVLSDVSTSDPEFGTGVEIETNMYEREKRKFRPLYFMSKEHVEEFADFELLQVEEIEYWETHPGEHYEHKHVFLFVAGRK